jgi:hypothetical protein
MSDLSREWRPVERTAWWIKLLVASLALASSALIGGKWIYTRASIEDVAALDQKKEDRTDNRIDHARIEGRVDASAQVLGNVRDNLIILMERSGAKPAPLEPTRPLSEPMRP